ncbi:MAG: hypothetical protein A2Z20_09045 [Bdellovibrionales bacterium RBG_16_40_8]|nr:MAG: hypothetical protein A2Z20_09045 [Bdellovibrionales bacterium RBG_16_40_8]
MRNLLSMPTVSMICRFFLGGVFFIFSTNYFLQFFAMPPMSAAGGGFMGSLAQTGYFFTLLKVTELAASVLLLTNIFVPLAVILLAPIVVNIFAFHLFLEPAGLPIAMILVILESMMGWFYWSQFKPLFAIKRFRIAEDLPIITIKKQHPA